MKKKALIFILCLTIALCMSACGGATTKTPISNDNSNTSDSNDSDLTKEQAKQSSKSETAEKAAVAIEDGTVLVDRDGIVVTARKLVDDSIWGYGVKVLMENNSDKNIGVQCNSLIVNNYMIADMFSSSIAAGKKSNDTIYLSSSGLEAAGIETISDIVFKFRVYDSDSYDTLFDTDEIELKTSAYGIVDQPAMDDGKELFSQDGIRIIGRYVEEGSFWGAGVLLFIENNYGENILVQCDNMSINGFMVTPFFSCTVNNGRRALDDITVFSSDLKENDIESVENIEIIFKIIDPDTYHTIIETEPVTFSVE
ncbi:MAG: hypothetical protein VB078_02495 [Clostridiaceae bacterium]|nr:hypothetical protein [Clostridiaceae bacterium]